MKSCSLCSGLLAEPTFGVYVAHTNHPDVMSQQLKTMLNQRYEVRCNEPCTVTDAAGLHLCTAIPGCVAEFFGDGHPVTLSADSAVMRELPYRAEIIPWNLRRVENLSSAINLEHKLLYRAGELAELTLRLDSPQDDLFCELCFTSGSTPTALTAPAEWKWSGDHLSGGVFVPQSNTRYRLVVLSDGLFIRAAAEGIAI